MKKEILSRQLHANFLFETPNFKELSNYLNDPVSLNDQYAYLLIKLVQKQHDGGH